MFRNRIKLFVELDPGALPPPLFDDRKRFHINFAEPIRDVTNVTVKQIIIPPWSTGPTSNALSAIYVKSDLTNLARSINCVTSSTNSSRELVLAVAPKTNYPGGGFYYKNDYPDERTQNRINLNGFWVEFYQDGDTPIYIRDLPQVQWKITLELELGIQNEQYMGDRLF